MIWWVMFFGLNLLPDILAVWLVPIEHRKRYQAAQSQSAAFRIAQGLAFLVPTVAIIQSCTPYAASFPLTTRLSGTGLMLIGGMIELWAFRANPYLIPDIERPPRIITDGPYAVLRHPFYLGCTFRAVGRLFLLGQDWAIVPLALYLGMLFMRARTENKLL